MAVTFGTVTVLDDFSKLVYRWTRGTGACHLHCLFRVPLYVLGDSREVQVLVTEGGAFGSLCAKCFVDRVVFGVTGGCSLLDIACRLGEGTGSNDGQRPGKDCEEVHV